MKKELQIEYQRLERKIKTLNETLWDNKTPKESINKWLDNFENDKEKLYALYLLSKFTYFGVVPLRNLLKSLYEKLYRYPIINTIRRENNNTLEKQIIEPAFKDKLKNTRFLGVGNPSESAAHLLYFFRQENSLPKNLFIYTEECFSIDRLSLKDDNINHYIFIDDLCGSGFQATNNPIITKCIKDIKKFNKNIKISYIMLFATDTGLNNIRDSKLYDDVKSLITLDDSYKCFGDNSRIFHTRNSFSFEKDFARETSRKHGKNIMKSALAEISWDESDIEKMSEEYSLGWGDCQLLLGFYHNTPNNTLPIMWYEGSIDYRWNPIFKRYNKKHSF